MLRSFRARAYAVGASLLIFLISGSFLAQLLLIDRQQRALTEATVAGALSALQAASAVELETWLQQAGHSLSVEVATLRYGDGSQWRWESGTSGARSLTFERPVTMEGAASSVLVLTLALPTLGAAMREALVTIAPRWLVAIPTAALLLLWLFRGPARSLQEIRRFIDRLPAEVGRTLDTRGHASDFAEVIAAMNRASALLAEQQQQLSDLAGAARNFSSIVQNTGIGLLLTNRKREIEWANAGFTRLTGYSAEESLGRQPVVLLDAVGTEPESLRRMAEEIAAGRPVSLDLLCRRADGGRRWLRVDAEPVRDANGEVTGYMALHTDATPRLQALEALRGGQAVLSAVAKVADRMLRSRDGRDQIDASLRELARAAGAQRALLLQLDAERGVATADVSVHSIGFAETAGPRLEIPLGPWLDTLQGGQSLLLGGFPGPSGSAATLPDWPGSVALSPVLVDDQLWGILAMDGGMGAASWSPEQQLAFGAAADILGSAILSARRNDALSDERAFAAQVLEGVFDGVAVVDGAGRVIFANHALQEMLGASDEDLSGRSLPELGLQATRPRSSTSGEPVASAIHRYETTLPFGDLTRTLMVREATTPFGDRDERRIVLVSDISERKHLEEELRRAATSAEAASEAKSRLLGRVSHELRTPLNAVLGFAQLAALDATTPELRDSVTEIQRAGAHLDRLINDLIDVSRNDTGDLKIEFEHVDLEAVARESLALITPMASGATVSVRLEVVRSVRIIADPGRLMQILLNLLSNALKYNREGGEVVLRVGLTPDGAQGRVEVEDSGPGISAEERHNLFTPFERLSNAGDRAGTGIGLALSRILAERMGGEIGVESREGIGSRFWVDFALAPEREQGAWR